MCVLICLLYHVCVLTAHVSADMYALLRTSRVCVAIVFYGMCVCYPKNVTQESCLLSTYSVAVDH